MLYSKTTKKPTEDQFENFKTLNKNKNICEKPFRATCNKDKIYKHMLSIEERLDRLDYDIYLQNKKLSGDYNRRQEDLNNTATNARDKATLDMEKVIANKNSDIKKQIYRSQRENVNKLKKKHSLQKIKNKQNLSNMNNKFNNENAHSEIIQEEGFKIKLSGKGPEANVMSKMLNKSSKKGSLSDKKEWGKSKGKVKMPSGFVL